MDYTHLILGIISGILGVVAAVPYIKDILHGSTRPNTVSWALWVLLLLISILAQISAGASWSLVFLIGDFLGTSAVLILCLGGYGYKEYGWIEWVCLALAIIAIVSWQLTNQPILAIVFAIIADFMAAVPTVIKAYRDPWSEHAGRGYWQKFYPRKGSPVLTVQTVNWPPAFPDKAECGDREYGQSCFSSEAGSQTYPVGYFF